MKIKKFLAKVKLCWWYGRCWTHPDCNALQSGFVCHKCYLEKKSKRVEKEVDTAVKIRKLESIVLRDNK
jgi:hypothetical protein